MDDARFDALVKRVSDRLTRRATLTRLVALGGLAVAAAEAAARAKPKRRKNKKKKRKIASRGCKPRCAAAEECIGRSCYRRCDPPCGSGEGCVGGLCVSLSGGCPATTSNFFCDLPVSSRCPGAPTIPYAYCARLDDGQPFCTGGVGYSGGGLETCGDPDCPTYLWPRRLPNARCVQNCAIAGGASTCLGFYLDIFFEENQCMPYGHPCRSAADCCQGVPCSGQLCRYPG